MVSLDAEELRYMSCLFRNGTQAVQFVAHRYTYLGVPITNIKMWLKETGWEYVRMWGCGVDSYVFIPSFRSIKETEISIDQTRSKLHGQAFVSWLGA
jgi:hypothetical protein